MTEPDGPALQGIVATPEEASARIIMLEIKVRDLQDRVALLENPPANPLFPA